MNYKELLGRYKNGLTTDEENHLIESELERHEALEEYLSDMIDEEFCSMSEVSEIQKHSEEAASLRKSVNKKFRKIVFISVATVAALYIAIFFVISPFVDSLYYNPGEITVGNVDNDISFDVYAISELNMPGLNPSNVRADKKGFGKHEVVYSYMNVFNNGFYNINYNINRGRSGSFYGNHVSYSISNEMFTCVRFPDLEGNHEVRKQAVLNHLNKLNPVTYVSAGIVFERDLSMDELHNLELKYPGIEFEWAGIRTDTPENQVENLIGIGLINSKSSGGLLGDESIGKKYPAFFILDWLVNSSDGVNVDSDSLLVARAYEHHCVDLLEYVVDRKKAVNVLEPGRDKGEFYRSALGFVKAHGVKTYGVFVFAEADDLLKMVEEEHVKNVEINQALVSKKNID